MCYHSLICKLKVISVNNAARWLLKFTTSNLYRPMKVGTDDLTMITLNYYVSIVTMKDTKDLDVVEAIIRGFSVVDDKSIKKDIKTSYMCL